MSYLILDLDTTCTVGVKIFASIDIIPICNQKVWVFTSKGLDISESEIHADSTSRLM